MTDFVGRAALLTDADIAAHAAELGIEPAAIAAVAEVESAGAGFLPDGRPKILYEAHVFGRLTAHRYDASHPNISAPAWDKSLYGATGAHQYDRLAVAMRLDRPAALQSASWGRFQILGMNYSISGFATVEAFVAAMCESEGEHLDAFISYCRSRDLLRHLAAHDWRSFAKIYNGPGQVDYYAQKIAEAYRRHAKAAPAKPAIATADLAGPQVGGMPNAIADADNPDWHFRQGQRLLLKAGLLKKRSGAPATVEDIDGDPGDCTRDAARRWREAHPAAGQPGI